MHFKLAGVVNFYNTVGTHVGMCALCAVHTRDEMQIFSNVLLEKYLYIYKG